MKRIILVALAATSLVACSYKPSVSAYGTTALVTMRDGTTMSAELIAMRDDSLIVRSDRVLGLANAEVREVYVDIPQDRGLWITQVALFEAIPSVALLVSSEQDAVTLGVIGTFVTIGTVAAFVLTEPREHFDWPPPASHLNDLLPHFRHPYGLTEEQLEALRRDPLAPTGGR